MLCPKCNGRTHVYAVTHHESLLDFYECPKCNHKHKVSSNIGKKHLIYNKSRNNLRYRKCKNCGYHFQTVESFYREDGRTQTGFRQ